MSDTEQHRDADVAQSVAHLIGSEEVTGSIPVISLNRIPRNTESTVVRGFSLPGVGNRS